MRWLMLTRLLDPADDIVGFAARWVAELAARVDQLDVICQEDRGAELPPNVTVYRMGKETGAGRLAQAVRLTAHLRRLVPQVDGVFCHMIPRYVLFAAPWARFYRRPLLHWYVHPQASPELRLARALATHILTAAPGSYPLPTGKLHVMGHGIEADLFPAAEGEDSPPQIVMAGRLAHIKRQDWLLRAASRALAQENGAPFRVVIVGGPVEREPDYPTHLREIAAGLDPAPDVTFTGPLPRAQMAAIVRRSALAVNLTPPGAFDKSALESMIMGKPTLVTTLDFLPLLGEYADRLYLPTDADDAALAERLVHLLALSLQERAGMGRTLRERALAAHSLDGLMDRIAALMREVAGYG